MESLTTMMSIIDHNSQSISDGDYLKLCNLMMDLHKTIPKQVTTTRDDLTARSRALSGRLHRLIVQIRQIRHVLASTKIRQRITASVKRDAISELSERHNLNLKTLTFEGLEAVVGNSITNPHAFFRKYLDADNQRKMSRLDDERKMLDIALSDYDRIRENIREVEAVLRQHE